MEAGSVTFPANVTKALADTQLQHAMTETGPRFIAKRAKAREALPEFDALRDISRDIKNHVLDNLDIYLERYEEKVTEVGGQVHWASTAEDARQTIIGNLQGRRREDHHQGQVDDLRRDRLERCS